jgi:hypothetical protein
MPSAPMTGRAAPRAHAAAVTAFCFERTPVRPGTFPAAPDRLWVGQVRRLTETRLRYWGLGHLRDDAGLLVSELVTNALLYGNGDSIRVRITCTHTGAHLAVRSGFTDPDRVRIGDAGPGDENGRGLMLVAALAEDWGVDRVGWVWCTVPAAAP